MVKKMEILNIKDATNHELRQLTQVRELKVLKNNLKTFTSNPNNHGYMIMDKDKVIAFAWGYTLERLDCNPMMYIHSVDVINEYRNQGVGKKLVKIFIDYAKEHNYRNTFLITDKGNLPANKLYQSFSNELEVDKNLYIFK